MLVLVGSVYAQKPEDLLKIEEPSSTSDRGELFIGSGVFGGGAPNIYYLLVA